MIARVAVFVAVGGCVVGYPADGRRLDGRDDGSSLPDPACDAGSIEPDDGRDELEVSQIGVASSTVRTFCGHVSRATNDGRNYTGDLDVALVHTLEPGRLSLVLSWEEGRTDLDVLLSLDPQGKEWAAGPDGVVEEQLPAGVYTVLVAGSDGPETDYQLDVWLD